MSDQSTSQLYLESLTLVCQWDFVDFDTDTCELCKKYLMELPPTKDKVHSIYNVDKIPAISIGECKHVFHTYCIDNYVKTNPSCPIDNTPWTSKRNTITSKNEVSSLNTNKIQTKQNKDIKDKIPGKGEKISHLVKKFVELKNDKPFVIP